MVGPAIQPTVLKLVKLRNQAAREIGYPDHYTMAMELQEIDQTELFRVLDALESSLARFS